MTQTIQITSDAIKLRPGEYKVTLNEAPGALWLDKWEERTWGEMTNYLTANGVTFVGDEAHFQTWSDALDKAVKLLNEWIEKVNKP